MKPRRTTYGWAQHPLGGKRRRRLARFAAHARRKGWTFTFWQRIRGFSADRPSLILATFDYNGQDRPQGE